MHGVLCYHNLYYELFTNVWVVSPLFSFIMFGWVIEYPSLSVCICMCMVNPLCHYSPTMELVSCSQCAE